jgi:hypothetical protein
MTVFHNTLNSMELMELHLQGRLFTCSNEQQHPTLCKIDRALTWMAWCDLYPNHALCALSTTTSDHASLLLHTDVTVSGKPRFQFETICPKFLGYLDAIDCGWNGVPISANVDAFKSLDIKLCNTAKELKHCSQKFVGNVRFQLVVAKEVIFKLDQAQDRHQLSCEEVELRTELKFKCLGLASLARTIARQRSRILHHREGDTNTCYFQLQASHHSRKSFIDRIVHHSCGLVDEESKVDAIFQHFNTIFGTDMPISCVLNLDQLQLGTANLSRQDFFFFEDKFGPRSAQCLLTRRLVLAT